MNTTNQTRVMHYAHILYNDNLFPTMTSGERWKACLNEAWELHYLRQLLAHGVVEFAYIKQGSYTIRTARGTNCLDIIPLSKHPNGHQQHLIDAGVEQPNYKSIAYYDLDKENWRAFSVTRFVQVKRVMAITPIEY